LDRIERDPGHLGRLRGQRRGDLPQREPVQSERLPDLSGVGAQSGARRQSRHGDADRSDEGRVGADGRFSQPHGHGPVPARRRRGGATGAGAFADADSLTDANADSPTDADPYSDTDPHSNPDTDADSNTDTD